MKTKLNSFTLVAAGLALLCATPVNLRSAILYVSSTDDSGSGSLRAALASATDGDGQNNGQEYLADTSPVDANDYLHITSISRSGTYNVPRWTSKLTRLYQVQRCASLDASSPWDTIITSDVPGWNNVGFDNTGPRYFYRTRMMQP